MKKSLILPALALIFLPACGTDSGSAESSFGGARAGYFNSASARSGHPMHWRKREPLRIRSFSEQKAEDPVLSQLTPEDIENIKKLRQKQN